MHSVSFLSILFGEKAHSEEICKANQFEFAFMQKHQARFHS